jgi:hypothetical protein
VSTGVVNNAWRQRIAGPWTTATVKAVLLSSSYVYSAAHDFLNDVSGGARLSTITVPARTNVNGVCGCGPLVFGSIAAVATQIVMFEDTGVESTSTLIFYASRYVDGGLISIPTTVAAPTFRVGTGPNGVFAV